MINGNRSRDIFLDIYIISINISILNWIQFVLVNFLNDSIYIYIYIYIVIYVFSVF